ncbi:tripartite ATP-independent transporter DctM subunit [Stella humosa]|uniref:TRAP transporter large permease protein n=1 Tax=Stella humosa TaxID=94 RepID=A0A3N1KQM0_9PROT|nr:TRAP transporter large permease [Stella humosa]ROP84103.1 tripartite ATP-independent transporter DctM subunit [Stella humosa]BBK33615.1 C4-dicarboxylate ABC transporter [Stella humosa]
MSELEIGWLLFGVTTLVLFSGVPIAFGLLAVSIGFLLIFAGPASLAAVGRTFFEEMASFVLLTIPMFILLGAAIGVSRAGADIYESLHRWLSRVPGGLVIANILACGMFSAVCGSSPATAAAIGKVGIPEMLRRGYPPTLATGSICAGGTLGILIPPSVTLILYGIATETSIGRLFLAGVIPGFLLVVLFAAYAWIYSLLSAAGSSLRSSERFSLREKMDGLGRVMPFLVIMVVIAVAMYGGWATPSEIAALSAFLALLLVFVIYRATSPQEVWAIFSDTVRESTMIIMIIGAAGLFGYMMSLLYITQTMADALVAWNLDRWTLLLFFNVLLLILGCFLPPVAIILMTMPILQPVLEGNDFNLIWFGILLTINMEVGLITPPVGLNLYVIRGVAPQVPLTQVLAGSMPFVVIMLLFMVLLCIFPQIALWLPNTLMGPGS